MKYLIDGNGYVLGRLATYVAKLLLEGNEVVIINAEKLAISGRKENIVAKYKQKLEWKDKANPEHSPYWSRRPDLLVKRIIRGMLPYKRKSGREAYKRLRVFIGENVKGVNLKEYSKIEPNAKRVEELKEKYLKVEELSKLLGYVKL
ncbi:MAG: 50S ribosomal protein L13 [Candidatus Micrarchaeia archaeon]|jgi:large subunit ribosomal protein L13